MITSPAYSVFRAALPPAGPAPHRRGDLCTTRAATRRRRGADDPEDDDDARGAARPSGPSRRDFMMRSVLFAALGAQADSLNTADGRTVVNSILGAYGLPPIAGGVPGFRAFDDFAEEYSFLYPAGWVRRKNTLREGLQIADFQTADKLAVEVFPVPAALLSAPSAASDSDILASPALAAAVVEHLLNPGREVGGDSRIEAPRPGSIKSEVKVLDDGRSYLYLAFPSSTTTRSGYDVRRRNAGVAGVKRGRVYALGVSVRGDAWSEAKARTVATVVESFRVRGGGGGPPGQAQT